MQHTCEILYHFIHSILPGLQMGYFLERSGRDYMIFERNAIAGMSRNTTYCVTWHHSHARLLTALHDTILTQHYLLHYVTPFSSNITYYIAWHHSHATLLTALRDSKTGLLLSHADLLSSGSFFTKYPRHGKLISINKRFTGRNHPSPSTSQAFLFSLTLLTHEKKNCHKKKHSLETYEYIINIIKTSPPNQCCFGFDTDVRKVFQTGKPEIGVKHAGR